MVSENTHERIAAIVVTYNRKALLVQCLEALLNQSRPLDAIYIIDNCSSDGTYDLLRSKDLVGPVEDRGTGPCEVVRPVVIPAAPGRSVQVHYVRMHENTGGAGGFHEGMSRGAQAAFDWLWLMDDDLAVAPDALEALVRKAGSLAAVHGRSLLLNCLVLSKDRMDDDHLAFPLQELSRRGYPKRGVYHWRLSEVQDAISDGLYRWACPFNGTFLSSQAVAQVGLPSKDFFIEGDEKDFFWRAVRRLAFYTVVDSRAYHPEVRLDVFGWKQYYNIRNMFAVNKQLNLTALRNLRLAVVSLLKGARHGRAGLRLVLRAISDGLAGHLGKREDLHT
jgi:rhamnopyranosyl-N-acetylglucosaminyl-diphospho-decaprenol beta-1,3/1,4-galactofuranosyltransferase